MITTKGKIIRVFSYVFEFAFFTTGVVAIFLHDAPMFLSSLAMSEICRLHRNMQDLSVIIAKIITKQIGGKE